MEIGAMLDELREMALKDEKIRQELLDTRKDAHPLAAFCSKCRELGYEIYEMDHSRGGILCNHAPKYQWRWREFA